MRRRTLIHSAALSLFIALLAMAATQPPILPPSPDIRSFRPSINGFAFVNHFTGSPIPFNLGGLEHKLGAPAVFGLCGGMSFAAADLFLARRSPPTQTSPPSKGQNLFDFIQQRQLISFGPNLRLAGRFGRWMALPDDGALGTRILTLDQLDLIAAEIAAGRPVVVGLVFNHHASNHEARGPAGVPWENHQVLAYALSPMPHSTSGAIDIHIYDPNYPKADDAILRCRPTIVGSSTPGPWCAIKAPILGLACERIVGTRRPTPIRGLFAMPYTPAAPPESIR